MYITKLILFENAKSSFICCEVHIIGCKRKNDSNNEKWQHY